MYKTIAFFDFDGTLTNKDSMLALAIFKTGKAKFWWKMARLSPSLIALKLNFLSAQIAKQLFLKSFFGGMKAADFETLCNKFSEQILPAIIRKDAWNALQNHLAKGHKVVIVSASAEDWIKLWCNKNNLPYIATRLEVKSGIITGNISGINCNGNEKVNRIKELFSLSDLENIYAYGDSSGDKAMLSIATHPGFRKFKG